MVVAAAGLADLVRRLQALPAVRAKADIGLVTQVLGATDWYAGPGDDGAVLPAAEGDGSGSVVVCGEAMLPELVAADPYAAGVCAVLANANDLAAMGARPLAIVDTVVGPEAMAREVLRGMRWAGERYGVPIVGGHLTRSETSQSVSAFGVGRATRVLSMRNAAAGQTLVVGACTDGRMREDFLFFPSFAERGERLAQDVLLPARLAEQGLALAAKDVSMAGLVGSLAMLLEPNRLGVTVDLDLLPVPAGVPMGDWLSCFPCLAFLLTAPDAEAGAACVAAYRDRGLAAAAVGVLDDTGLVRVRRDAHDAVVFDLTAHGVTNLG